MAHLLPSLASLLLLLLLLLLPPPRIFATVLNVQLSEVGSEILLVEKTVFGYSRTATLTASFSVGWNSNPSNSQSPEDDPANSDDETLPSDEPSLPSRNGEKSSPTQVEQAPLTMHQDQGTSDSVLVVSLCNVSDIMIRDFDYRRHYVSKLSNLEERCMQKLPRECDPNQKGNVSTIWSLPFNNLTSPTQPSPAEFNTSFALADRGFDRDEMYMLTVHICPGGSEGTFGSFNAQVKVTNPGFTYSQLGFEERLFPLFSIVLLAIQLSVLLLAIATAPLCWFYLKCRFPFPVIILAASSVFKALFSGLTLLHFRNIAAATDDEEGSLYIMVRALIAPPADLMFMFLVASTANSLYTFPRHWFVDRSSQLMYMNITLVVQLMIYGACKTMFPYGFVNAVFYLIFIVGILGILFMFSFRNVRFLGRFATLISSAGIDPTSTPIPRLRFFHIAYVPAFIACYLTKVVCIFIFDNFYRRPDLFWGLLETCDTILLVFIGVFILPLTRRAPLYVDMSAVDTAPGYTSYTPPWNMDATETSTDSAQESPAATPALTEWSSGMPLPLPNGATWGEVTDGVDVQLPTAIPKTIVLGSPTPQGGSVTLAVGWPISGPLAKPDGFDDGTELDETTTKESTLARLRRHKFNFRRNENLKQNDQKEADQENQGGNANGNNQGGTNSKSSSNDSNNVSSSGDHVNRASGSRNGGREDNEFEENAITIADLVRSSSISSTDPTVDGIITPDRQSLSQETEKRKQMEEQPK